MAKDKIGTKLAHIASTTLFQRVLLISLSLLFITIIFFSPAYFSLDSMSYDLFMRYIKKPIDQDDSLILIDIDDNTMNMEFIPYSWPWPRYIHGDAVEVMADFGLKAAVFDIEFLNKSAAGVNVDEMNSFKGELRERFQSIYSDFSDISRLLASNRELQRDTSPVEESFNERLTSHYFSVEESFNRIMTDNDRYFADRLRYYGRAYGTVNMLYDKNLSPEESRPTEVELNFLKSYSFLSPESGTTFAKERAIFTDNVAEFPYELITQNYRKVGFTRVDRDSDGATRRISLLREKSGYIIPQLALTPFLDIHGITPGQLDLSRRGYITLKDVQLKSGVKDIKIPLDSKGYMKINWPSGTYDEIFISTGAAGHFSYANLLNYKYNLLGNFSINLANFANFPPTSQEYALYESYIELSSYKENIIAGRIEDGLLGDRLRERWNLAFDSLLEAVLEGSNSEMVKAKELEIERAIEEGGLSGSAAEELLQILETMRTIYREVNSSTSALVEARALLKEMLEDKIGFIGLVATGTTDISPVPFDKEFKNVGTHPAVYNTLLQNSFIYSVPDRLIYLLSLLTFSLIIWLLVKLKKALVIASSGLITTVAVLLLIILLYRFAQLYISPVIPFLYGLTGFICLIVLKFMLNEQEKSLIRKTFNRYLSPLVINDLLKNPAKIVLGGERRVCTAIFTDIQGFSSISEQFMEDPKALINLLNSYLSEMSDIILDNRGIIDKYEGDAIIGFFGAPGYEEEAEHAYRACLSSIRMKEAEARMNRLFAEQGLCDRPMLTRIGINTGSMVVGNMGSDKRLDYTMIGHAVNLAARLEGVNKQYGTYQLISEFTYNEVAERVITRRLDRVRVVNIKTPIRLYELIGLTGEVRDEVLEALNQFDRGLELFEVRVWDEAASHFAKARLGNGFDKAVDIYIERCRKFKKRPPEADWDGVYNLTVK